MRLWLMFLASSMLMVSGCAWTGQELDLKPSITVKEASLGNNRTIAVEVDDERPRKALGNKIPEGGGEINSKREPKEIVQEALVLGLTRLGFKPITTQNVNGNKLKAELRSIDYRTTMGFWAGTVTVDVALKGICIVDGRYKYEKLQRGNHQESIMVVQSEENNKEFIEDAMTQAINSVLTDDALIQCLAGL